MTNMRYGTKMLHPSRVTQIVGSWEWRSEEVETERGIGGEKNLKKGPVDHTIAKTTFVHRLVKNHSPLSEKLHQKV